METNEMKTVQPAGYSAEGMEIKLSGRKVNLMGIGVTILFVIAGTFIFEYVWGKQERALEMFAFKGFYLLAGFLTYLFIQLLLYVLFLKGRYRSLKVICDRKGIGFLCKEPIALKYYRVILITPAILIGLIPAVHGFCTGDLLCYGFGLFFLFSAFGDCLYFWKLRHFNDEDKIKDGEESFSGSIIKSTF